MRGEYTEKLIVRASRDEEFRRRLLEDPRAAVSEELGVEIPEGLTIRAIEEGPGEVILPLPPSATPEPLRDEELAAAAGGAGWACSMGPTHNDSCHSGPTPTEGDLGADRTGCHR